MKVRGRKPTIIYWVAAFLVVLGCLVWTRMQRPVQAKQSAQILVLGDSTFAYTRDETSIPSILERELGKTVYNGSLGGTCASRESSEEHLDFSLDSVSFCAIARAFSQDDFSVQKMVKGVGNGTEYFQEAISGLSFVDIEKVEIILVLYGVNDNFAGRLLDAAEKPEDEYTFGGALRSGLRRLRACNPSARIVLVTPTYNWLPNLGQTCEEYSENGSTLADYVELEKQIGVQEQVEVLDLYHEFYPHDTWEDWKRYTIDGVHPNEAGRKLIADTIIQFLKGEEK